MALWTDLSSLSKDRFVGELDGIFGELRADSVVPRRNNTVKAVRQFPSDDRPVTRIAFVLLEEKILSTTDARRLLVQALIAQGYGEDDIPNSKGKSLEEWLEALLLHIPSSDVMHAAKELTSL